MFRLLRNWTRPGRRAIRQLMRLKLSELAYFETLSFSQFGEDLLLEQLLGQQEHGFYVDVGAYHPYRFSNTYRFYRRGWTGINLEPNPASFARFQQDRPRDTNLQLAVSSTPGTVKFVCDSAYSGISDDQYPHLGRSQQASEIEVQCRPLSSILDEHLPAGSEIDFMSIDCEGHDLEVLRSNDWSKYRPRFLLVEDKLEATKTAVDKLMDECGFRYHTMLTMTKVFVDGTNAAVKAA